MDFFDKIGKKASEAYKMTADKTGKLAKETKLKLKMGELKAQINDVYEEIGKRVYEKHIRESDETAEQEIEEKCVKIDVLSDEVESLLKECMELNNKKQCQQCHAEIEKEAKFCKHCGAKQEEPAKEPEILEVQVVETVEVTENKDKVEQEKNGNVEKSEQGKDENTEKVLENKDEKNIENNLEETVAVESDVEISRENTEKENENLEKTVEIESNVELEEKQN